ncbi:putative copper resistance protein D [Ruegeria halocynthiae]|uniref:Putative copper resistance protein D n=1 Tax=Ruegeria halocynthiae TaxID=985054 RepID=A0A1H3D7P4_9RHOB|nr:CopD family protein [Ruegeria halocynthiae]SDX62542.1 putative copper resistance protein D [Ruegeria halocynthiae]
MTGLAPIDGVVVLAILAKALGYGAALLAMGSILFTVLFATRAEASVLRLARHLAVGAALLGLAVLALRFGIRAARISGMGFEGATDPMMLGIVWDSPLGTAAIWRGVGELAILAILLPRVGQWVALAGSLAIAISFAQVGHSLGEPRAPLAVLLFLHLLAVAFWVGALLPLHKAALTPTGADLLHHFGNVAAYGVAVLIVAGAALAWLLSGSVVALFGTAYGLVLLAKVVIVSALLGLAALNKLRFVPALRAEKRGAEIALRRSISMEMLAVVLILFATATLTSVTTPPINL